MKADVFLYIIVMAVVTYSIRVLPLTLVRREITNPLREILFRSRTLCHVGSDDFPCYIGCHSISLVCLNWIHYCHRPILFWWKLI